MTYLRTSLQKIQRRSPTTSEELHGLRTEAWHKQHCLSVSLEDPGVILDDWERQTLENVGNRLFGERRTG